MAAPASVTVAQVETGARNLHPRFDQRTATTRILREHLYRKASDLLATVVGMYPDPFLVCEFEYDLPPADFEGGELFPDAIYQRAGRVFWSGDRSSELHLVRDVDLKCPPYWPAAAVVGGHIYLGRSESDWIQGVSATVRYVPPIEALTSPDSTLDPLPGYAESALVAELGLFLARRAELPAASFVTDRNEAQAAFLTTATGFRRAVHKKVRRYR